MTRTKHGFKDFRLEDLTGGINTRDYASEIEDKQSLSLINYNFKGNKLVSSKGVDNVYTGSSLIQGFTTDGDDKWHIEATNLYKNGILEHTSLQYNLYIENINGGLFDIEIDGNKYLWNKTLGSETLAYDDFVADLITLLGANYTVVKDVSETFIVITKLVGTDIIFANPDIIETITLSSWDVVSGVPNRLDITIEGANIATNSTDTATTTALATLIEASTTGVTAIADGLKVYVYNDDLSALSYSNETTLTSYYYDIKVYSGYTSSGLYKASRITTEAGAYLFDYPEYYPSFTYFNIDSCSGTQIANTRWRIPTDPYFQIRADTTNYTHSAFDYCNANTNASGALNIYAFINRKDWGPMTFYAETQNYLGTWSEESTNTSLTLEDSRTTTVTIGSYINAPLWTAYNNSLGFTSDEFYDITVSSLGTLITSRSGNAPVFIDTTGTVTTLTSGAVGEPTVGIIYNGKIVLGGYADSDNIVFSQTEDPVAAGNEMLNFASYSAGAQSVSGGNKGTVRGFIVGENGLYVLKGNEIWYTNSEKDTGTSFNFIFKKITSNGTANQSSTSEVDQETLYFDYINRAVRRLGYEQNLTTLRDVAISREIEDLFLSIPDGDEWGRSVTTSYAYPLYKVEFALEGATQYTMGDGNYRIPNTTAVYNVENKSWALENNKLALQPIHSYKGFFATYDGSIYQDDVGNTLSDGDHLSKEYVFIDDVDYKRMGEIEITGDLIGDGGTKNLEISVLIDGEEVEIGETATPYKRIITAADGITNRFREKIDLYDDGRIFQFALKHNGVGRVEINDVNARVKALKINQYYY